MTRRPSSLPDLSDDELARRLNPLAVAILPSQASIEVPPSLPQQGDTVLDKLQPAANTPDDQASGVPVNWSSEGRASRVAAAAQLEKTAAARGERRGIEFLLPERVIAHLRQEAAAAGISLSLRLLQILRDANYPVIAEDFVDLRKMPKR